MRYPFANETTAADREAKFGVFIHWGIYAIPAEGEWHMKNKKISFADYSRYAGQFNPVKFDADQWMAIAQDAGMKYLVITAKHHDGFAMFDSKGSNYNIDKATPFKRAPSRSFRLLRPSTGSNSASIICSSPPQCGISEWVYNYQLGHETHS